MEDLELGYNSDAAAGEVLPGDHEQLHKFMRAGLRRKLGGIYFPGRERRDFGERDGGRDAE